MAYPRFFDEKTTEILLNALSLGLTRRAAARCVGCHVRTIYNEAERDPEFAEKLSRAEVAFEARHKQRIDNASTEKSYWRASAWSLERRFPDEYAKRNPRTLSMAQIETILAQFAEILVRQIGNPEAAALVADKLWALIDAALTPDEKKGDSEDACQEGK